MAVRAADEDGVVAFVHDERQLLQAFELLLLLTGIADESGMEHAPAQDDARHRHGSGQVAAIQTRHHGVDVAAHQRLHGGGVGVSRVRRIGGRTKQLIQCNAQDFVAITPP